MRVHSLTLVGSRGLKKITSVIKLISEFLIDFKKIKTTGDEFL
jgi:hypothetical protein